MDKVYNKQQLTETFEVPFPIPRSNLLGYQSVNVIDPSYSEFMRNFIVNDYYLTIYGSKFDKLRYSVQYTKRYVDGRTIWYTEIMTLNQINDLCDRLENLDRLTERKMEIIDSVRDAKINEEIERKGEQISRNSKQLPIRLT